MASKEIELATSWMGWVTGNSAEVWRLRDPPLKVKFNGHRWNADGGCQQLLPAPHAAGACGVKPVSSTHGMSNRNVLVTRTSPRPMCQQRPAAGYQQPEATGNRSLRAVGNFEEPVASWCLFPVPLHCW